MTIATIFQIKAKNADFWEEVIITSSGLKLSTEKKF